MRDGDVCLFSPFSPATVHKEHNRVLLLQFLLHELFCMHTSLQEDAPLTHFLSREMRFFPYDWVHPAGSLNKAREHCALLARAFPHLGEPVAACQKTLELLIQAVAEKTELVVQDKGAFEKTLCDLYLAIEPLVTACQDNENLLFFLLKHQKKIDLLMGMRYTRSFLLNLYPKGLQGLEEFLCDSYHERGFFSLIPELRDLVATLDAPHA